jgi:hypothetical protein
MPTLAEVQTTAKVNARKRVYSALAEVKRLLCDLDIVPNMRDYSDGPDGHAMFRDARRLHASHVRAVVDLQNAMTGEARFLQGR